MEDGNVVLLSDGRMFRIIEMKTGIWCVQFMDRDEHSYLDPEKLDIEFNLGQSPHTLANFYASRSIHLRLNRMNKI